MSFNDLPSTEDLKQLIELKYADLAYASKSELERQKKIRMIQKDLKDFIRAGNTKMFEKSDQDIIFEAYKKIQKAAGFLLIPGFCLSIGLGTTPASRFRRLSFINRTLVRSSVVFIPIFLTYAYSYRINEQLTSYIELKYAERVQQYLCTKDPKSLNPSYEKA